MMPYICVHSPESLEALSVSIQQDGDLIAGMVYQVSQVQHAVSTEYIADLVRQHWVKRTAAWHFCTCSAPPFAERTVWEMYLDHVVSQISATQIPITGRSGWDVYPNVLLPARAQAPEIPPRGFWPPRLPLLYGPLHAGGQPLGMLGFGSLVIAHLTVMVALLRGIAGVVAWRDLPMIVDGVPLFVAFLCLWPFVARIWDAAKNGIQRDTLYASERWACCLFGVWSCAALAQMTGILPMPEEPVLLDALLAFSSCAGALAWIHALMA